MESTIATRQRWLAMAGVLEAAHDLEVAMTPADPLREPTRALMDQLGARLVTELELDPAAPTPLRSWCGRRGSGPSSATSWAPGR